MTRHTSCTHCARPLVDGQCPACDRDVIFNFVHRETVGLFVLCVIVVVGFMLTRMAAGANRALRSRDAAVWYDVGEAHLVGGQTMAAVTALRRAAAMERDNRRYRLALAAGLAADRQDDAARQVLLGIRESTPEDPDVNVQLARLEARHDDLPNAVRYYQNAMYGVWGVEQDEARRRVRIEMIRYLLKHDQRSRALSELLVLSSNIPDDAGAQTEAGRLFLDAGEARRALDHFRRALHGEPKNEQALVGAGEAAFAAGDYVSAGRYLRETSDSSTQVSEIRTISELVLTRDPLRTGLSARERQERLTLAFTDAVATVDDCLTRKSTTDSHIAELHKLRAQADTLQPQLISAGIRRSPEAIEMGMNLVYQMEKQTADACGQGSVVDQALRLIGRLHGSDQQ